MLPKNHGESDQRPETRGKEASLQHEQLFQAFPNILASFLHTVEHSQGFLAGYKYNKYICIYLSNHCIYTTQLSAQDPHTYPTILSRRAERTSVNTVNTQPWLTFSSKIYVFFTNKYTNMYRCFKEQQHLVKTLELLLMLKKRWYTVLQKICKSAQAHHESALILGMQQTSFRRQPRSNSYPFL